MVPDVTANADPVTGYEIVVYGQIQIVGGTSAVAPLFAGLFASFGKHPGFVGSKIWDNHGAFHDITVGNNGEFAATVGPDPASGLGSPIGTKLAALFAK
jgi:subtilase family serine protease